MKIYLRGKKKPVVENSGGVVSIKFSSNWLMVSYKTKIEFYSMRDILKIKEKFDTMGQKEYNKLMQLSTRMKPKDEIELARYAYAKKIDPFKIYSLDGVARLLGKSTRQIRRYFEAKKIRFIRASGTKKYEVLGQWILDFYKN